VTLSQKNKKVGEYGQSTLYACIEIVRMKFLCTINIFYLTKTRIVFKKTH
jgi:hypothetical protein